MLKEYLSTLANAFRSVLGTTDKINAQNFASKVNEVYEKGKAEGGDNDFFNMRTNNGKNFAYLFCACNHMVTTPILDTSNGTRFDYMFNACSSLITIPLLNISNTSFDITSSLTNIFNNCPKLENITFEGTIPKSISFNACSKLTKLTLDNIITALKDYSGTGTTMTLTLHADAKAKLIETDIATITQKGWTV